MDYHEFLGNKRIIFNTSGKSVEPGAIHPILFPFQRDIVVWAAGKGRCAVFLDTGLGKTFISLEWARLMGENTLIIAPLSVARQTVREGKKIELDVQYVRDQSEIEDGHKLWITNYEMVTKFDFSKFGAVVLDESSILKAIGGKTKRKLIRLCKNIPYRMCCTATPAPNDYIELGNHSEFLGVCTQVEMLAMFFINANKEHLYKYEGKVYRKKGSNKGGQEWRLKHPAEKPFFRWLSSWAICMTKPSDLGYDDAGFELPPLNIRTHYVNVDFVPEGQLFFTKLEGIGMRAKVRKDTIENRLQIAAELVADSDEQWVIWCGLNAEQDTIANILGDSCVSIYGTLGPDEKERRLELWLSGGVQFLISKPRICGFGLNLQRAHNMLFFGLNDSWETWYQCIRRQWRYLQEKPVNVHVVISDVETPIYHNVMRKDTQAAQLRKGLIQQMQEFEKEELGMVMPTRTEYEETDVKGNDWWAMLGDACIRLKELPDDSIDLSIYSPPFADLYTYTDSERDLGNSRGWDEFFNHYAYIISEVLRVTKPGRVTCVHTSDIPALAQKDGYIGVRDFPGEVIRAYEAEGWIFHGRAFVQKNPQAQAIRTHSQALLFIQLRKDSAASRPALIDQILIFRKPGDNAVPITPVENGELDNDTWVEWAHGIWLGIRETETLQYSRARDADDEKHICPLQLETIERCIKLYSNPGEMVLTPFGGIGSEGYMAVKLNRKAILVELKRSYFDVLMQNMREAEVASKTVDLFEWAGL